MKRTFCIFLIITLMITSLSSFKVSEGIYDVTEPKNNTWSYYRYQPIINSINEYQMRLKIGKTYGGDVNCNGHCNDNFSDIRFFDIDDTTELSYWLEDYTYGETAIFWIKLPTDAESDNSIIIYYGNPDATTTSNSDLTFERFMDKNDINDWYGNNYIVEEDDDSIYIHGDDNPDGYPAVYFIAAYIAPYYKIILKQKNNHQHAITTYANAIANAHHLHWHGRQNDNYDNYMFRVGSTTDYLLYSGFVTDRYYIYELEVDTVQKKANHNFYDASWNLLNAELNKGWYETESDGTTERITHGDGTYQHFQIDIWDRYMFIVKWTSGIEPSWGTVGEEHSIFPPTADFNIIPINPTQLDIINFIDNSSDIDGYITNWCWDFGDGNYSYEQHPSYQYQQGGNYSVCLYIIDNDGYTDEICKQLTVIELIEEVDVNQTIYDRGFPIRHTWDGDWGAAQNFTATLDSLTRCDIYIRKFGTPEFNLTIELREDTVDGPLIASLSIPPELFDTSWNWIIFDIEDIETQPGMDYFIVCPPAPSGISTSYGYEWGYAFGNQYDDGSFWFTRDGGNLWRDLPTMYEFVFRTYGYS
jgi:uncharacterized protein DUF2341/PKD domain-containing protein